ncbi:MAG TPA: cache domain-containing protein [Magnetospirillaceae bacterium]|jgi:methyl-accepting chemotaxis protein
MKIKSIAIRLFGIVAISAVGLIVLAFCAANTMKDSMVADSISKTNSLAEVARNIAQSFDERAKKGEFDTKTAQEMAKAAIRGLRYDGKEYFFAYDFNGVNRIHGADQTREGKSFIDLKDPTGYAYVRDMVKIGQSGGGHLFYVFKRPNSDVPAPKVSSVVPYQPWGWLFGTGTYIDDIDTRYWHAAERLGGIGLVILLIASAIAYLLSRTISKPITALADVTTQLGTGDYAIAIPAIGRADEVGKLARAIQILRDQAQAAESLRAQHETAKTEMERQRRDSLLALADNFEGSIKGVVESIVSAVGENDNAARSMTHVSEEAAVDVNDVADAANEVTSSIETVAAATEQLTASITEISHQIQLSSKVSSQAVASAGETDKLVQGLSAAVARINDVANLINDIAAKTNLLALNATIEAARAGDVGKGFAVVANEVKQLATQTAKATGEITDQIESVNKATEAAVSAIREIGGVIGSIDTAVSTIAAAVEEQSAATKEISRNATQAADGAQRVSGTVTRLKDVTKQVRDGATVVSRSSSSLNRQSSDLRHEMVQFLATVRA